MTKRFTARGRIESFRYAGRGILLMLRTQHNAWVHAAATVLVIAAGVFFGLSASEWSLLILAMMAVWTAEALNTAVELLADAASPDFHPLVEKAKDVAAGAVLISAIGSVIIGVFVLGPRVLAVLT